MSREAKSNTDDKEKRIELVYEGSCAELGERIGEWLVCSGMAAEDTSREVNGSGSVKRCFTALREIPSDSAIIFVSDEATAVPEWQEYIRSLPEDIRLIPVGGIEAVDYSDPQVLPPKIEEINFIRTDTEMLGNIQNSLVTDPAFYAVRNHLMAKVASWQISHHNSALMSNRKRIQEYTAVIQNRLESEEDPSMREQLLGIQEYLTASGKYAHGLFVRSVIRRLTQVLPALGLALLVVLTVRTTFNLVVSDNSHSILSGTSGFDPGDTAITMAGIIADPSTEEISKEAAFVKLVDSLDKVWEQTPIGMYYNDLPTDAAVPSGTQYLYTCTYGGRVLLWDTYTGEIKSKSSQLTDTNFWKIELSPDESVIAALDRAGAILLSCDGGRSWQKAGQTSAVPNESELRLTDSRLLVFDSSIAELYSIDRDNTGLLPAGSRKHQTIIDAGFTADGSVLLLYSKEGSLCSRTLDPDDMSAGGNNKKENTYEINMDDHVPADICGSGAVISDRYGQIWTIKDGKAKRTSLTLELPLILRWVNDHTIVYYDRETGTGLYDIKHSFDYGDVLGQFDAVEEIYATDEMIVVKSSYIYRSVAVDSILYRSELPAGAAAGSAVYRDKACSLDLSATNGNGVDNVRITEDGIILYDVHTEDGSATVALDPAFVKNNDSGGTLIDERKTMPGDIVWYPEEPFAADGVPVVVGVRLTEDDKYGEEPYPVIMAGCADGSFVEYALNSELAIATVVSRSTIPSRSAVAAIHFADGTYWLEDVNGNYWQVSSGDDLTTTDGILDHIKGRLHKGVGIHIKLLVSGKVWRALDLHMSPGGDGKDWG